LAFAASFVLGALMTRGKKMTAINIVQKKDEILIMTDGAGIGPGGMMNAMVSKVSIIPPALTVIAARGPIQLAPLCALKMQCEGLTFDAFIEILPDLARAFLRDIVSKMAGIQEQAEITVAGWSDREGAFAVYMMPCDDRYVGVHPYSLVRHDPSAAHVSPAIDPAAFRMPPLESFRAELHGVVLMEKQRQEQEYRGAIGGFLQSTRITRRGISSRIMYFWPDKIGYSIDPTEPGSERIYRSSVQRFSPVA
jgi:hypothetical protein